jgi:hypothetical protein
MKRALFEGSRDAFARLELMTILFISALVAFPLFFSATHRVAARSQRINCTKNLKQLGLALKSSALDHGDKFPMQVVAERDEPLKTIESRDVFNSFFQRMSNELANPTVLLCPADIRQPAPNWGSGLSNLNLSYFLGLDAMDTNPQMFLIGDRNLTNGPLPPNHLLIPNTNFPAGWTREMHHYQGNIGLADGSVQQYSNPRLSEALRTGASANRLAMP